jgi:phosphoesterase RecJ-like protein
VLDLVQNNKVFLLTTHVNPDGDGLGAESALYCALKTLGKKVLVVNRDPLPPRFTYLPFASAYRASDTIPPHDVCFVMDAGVFSRIREGVRREEFQTLVNIDHHYSNDRYGDVNLVDPGACSTGEIVFHLIQALGVPLDKGIAESVYTSLATDTGGFRYPNTTPQVLRLAAQLMEAGADGARISEKIFAGVSPQALEMVRVSLASVKIHERGRIGTIQLSRQELADSGATDEDSENLVNFVRKMEGVQIAVFLKEKPDGQIKLSLRSKTDANVALVAKKFGGGGHSYAAGAVLAGPLPAALKAVLKACRAVLK